MRQMTEQKLYLSPVIFEKLCSKKHKYITTWNKISYLSVHSHPDLESDTSVPCSVCGRGDKRPCEGLWTTELQWQHPVMFYFVIKVINYLPFFLAINQSTPKWDGFSLSLYVWCSTLTLWSDVTGFCFPCPNRLLTLPRPCTCMATFYQASCCCPFSFMLNSNHYFQRKASLKLLHQVFVLERDRLLFNTQHSAALLRTHLQTSYS